MPADKTMIRRALGPTTEIQDFDMRGFDGVDHGANQVDGWLVLKSADGGEPDVVELADLIQAETEWIEKADDLSESLEGFDFESAPSNVQAAVKILLGFLQAESGGASQTSGDDQGDGPIQKSTPGFIAWIMNKVGLSKSQDDEDIAAIAAAWPTFCSSVEKTLLETPRNVQIMKGAMAVCVADLAESVLLEKAGWTQAKRDKAEAEGHALPGGKFPIESPKDVEDAAGLVGNSTVPEAEAKAHIIQQAKRIGATSKLPESWKSK